MSIFDDTPPGTERNGLALLSRAGNLIEASIWERTLMASGIFAQVRNDILASAAGELPPDQCAPEVWVRKEDFHTARELLADLIEHRIVNRDSWTCPRCGEVIEGQFGQCWNCGECRPA